MTSKYRLDGGYLEYQINEEDVEVTDLRVNDRRKGIGSKLLDMVKDVAIQHDLPVVLCAYPVEEDMELSELIAFYEHNGFSVEQDDGNCAIMRW